MRKLYRKIVPLELREKVKEYQEYQRYHKLRQQDGHVYQSFDKTKSIFVHIPKAGGISIIKSLYGERAGGFGHPTYKRFFKLFGKQKFDAYYKFTFVRNPWDRLYSAYSFLKKGGMNHLDEKFSKEVISECETFESFVMDWLTPTRINNWIHFIPQYKFITNENNKVILDFIGKFENFESDFKHISNKLQIETSLVHLNKSTSEMEKSYRSHYSNEMKIKVGKLYLKDINLFDYKF